MVDAIVTESLRGSSVCVVLYGHPGFFAAPGHEAIRQVRANGLRAQMLPGVSALDCLFADLGIDPGRTGLQAYEATYFYRTQPPLDPRATLALLQVGMLGEEGGTPTAAVSGRFPLLVEMLRPHYGEGSEAILYEASQYPGTPPTIVRFQLRDRELPRPTTLATLCITPP